MSKRGMHSSEVERQHLSCKWVANSQKERSKKEDLEVPQSTVTFPTFLLEGKHFEWELCKQKKWVGKPISTMTSMLV